LKQLGSIPVARKTAVSKYLARIGRKGGKASGKARMEKLTPEQRVAVAKTAAAARWAKPVTQADLKRQSALQVAEWTADRLAQMGAEDINLRLTGGAAVKPGKLRFDKRLKMATAAKKATARPSVPVVAAKKSKAQPVAEQGAHVAPEKVSSKRGATQKKGASQKKGALKAKKNANPRSQPKPRGRKREPPKLGPTRRRR
jgi:hypothetical protein